MRNFWLLILSVVLFGGCRQGTTAEFVEEISCYSDYSTADWLELADKYYRPNVADWDSAMNERIVDGFPMDIASDFWHLLQNARTDFHQKSLPLRAEASNAVIEVLDKTESALDTVFVRCVSQEYYMRLFPEMYNETMKPAIDELVEELAKSGNNSP